MTPDESVEKVERPIFKLWICDNPECRDQAEAPPGERCEVCESGTVQVVDVVEVTPAHPEGGSAGARALEALAEHGWAVKRAAKLIDVAWQPEVVRALNQLAEAPASHLEGTAGEGRRWRIFVGEANGQQLKRVGEPAPDTGGDWIEVVPADPAPEHPEAMVGETRYRPTCRDCGYEDEATFTGLQMDTCDFRCPRCDSIYFEFRIDADPAPERPDTEGLTLDALDAALVKRTGSRSKCVQHFREARAALASNPPGGEARGEACTCGAWVHSETEWLEPRDPDPDCVIHGAPEDSAPPAERDGS